MSIKRICIFIICIDFSMSKTQQKHEQQTEAYCRICLQPSLPIKKLPCDCKGSLSYMHDFCFNQMLHVKLQNQKQDATDYVPVFSNKSDNQKTICVKCEICLKQIHLKKTQKLSWQKLMEVKIEIYFVLVSLICLCFFGLKIGLTLLEKALQNNHFVSKSLYFGAYIWIMGVILYVLLQPLYSEVKVVKFKIISEEVKFSKQQKIRRNLKKFSKQSNFKQKIRNKQLLNSQGKYLRTRNMLNQFNTINKYQDKQSISVKFYSKPKEKCKSKQFNSRIQKISYFEI